MAPGFSRSEASWVSTSSSSFGNFSGGPLPPSYAKSYDSKSRCDHTEASTTPTIQSTTPRQLVGLSDRQLLDLAIDSERSIQWGDILTRNPEGAASDRARWKRIDDAGWFAVYSKQEQHKFAVLAVGVLPCSVPEVVRLLHAPDAESFLGSMEGLHGEEFKDGAFIHRANLHKLRHEAQSLHDDDLMDLSVKTAVFNRSGWRQQHENWSFLEATYRRDNGTSFEKLTTTLSPKDVTVPTSRMSSSSTSPSTFPSLSRSSSDGRVNGKLFHDVSTAFCVQHEEHGDGDERRPRPDGSASVCDSQGSRRSKQTRVYFYGEFAPPIRSVFSIPSLTRSSSASATGKGIKQRLVAMARSCDRLTGLVRRRRIGVQVLVDRRVLSLVFSALARRCKCCDKSILLLAVKQCRLCGQGVCGECSHRHERETKVRGSQRMMLEDVRVCDRCLERIDRSDFSELNDTSLLGPVIYPNAPNAPEASTVLKDLLKNELIHADSNARMISVMNVIKCVLDQEDALLSPAPSTAPSSTKTPNAYTRRRPTGPPHPPPIPPTLSQTRSMSMNSRHEGPASVLLVSTPSQRWQEADYVDALDQLTVPQVPYLEAELATTNGRSYAVDASNPDKQMVHPMPANESDRLHAMETTRVKELINNSDELNIICELAAKEMDTFASMVTIVTPDEQQVVASNLDSLQTAKFPRAEAFCSHTIMDDKPLLIPHPEADVRFHQAGSVKDMGIRYYCGFPIKSEDDTVIGALCCINKDTVEMSETQFSAMQKLADTASKVIQVQGRKRSMSTASSHSNSTK